MFEGGSVPGMTVKSQLTVLHFANEPVRGGAEEHMLMLLNQLNRARFRPVLAGPPKLIKLLRDDLAKDIDTIPITLRSPTHITSAARFFRILAKQRVDILHSHMFQASKFASPLGWMARVPVRIETTHVREDWRRGWLKASFTVDRFVARFITNFIAVSAANARYLEDEKRVPARKISIIRNGVEVDRFDPEHSAPSGLLDSIGIEKSAPVALVLARLEAQKGHRILLEAWKSVSARFPTARLVCVGEGSLRNELEVTASSAGISPSVRFVGYQRNVSDWLALANFTILPSFYEGLPLVAIESSAAGRAVIATSVDGTVEVVLHGRTGLIVPPGEPIPLAAAICQLLGSSHMAQRMGREGRKFVEDQFSQQRQVAETEALYLQSWRAQTGLNTGSKVAPSFAIDDAHRSTISR
jgi:glycosyltransferase involved in cell wall biosynthesis